LEQDWPEMRVLAFYLLALDGKQVVYPLPVSKMGIPGKGGKRK
jgi:hypothetical protein